MKLISNLSYMAAVAFISIGAGLLSQAFATNPTLAPTVCAAAGTLLTFIGIELTALGLRAGRLSNKTLERVSVRQLESGTRAVVALATPDEEAQVDQPQ